MSVHLTLDIYWKQKEIQTGNMYMYLVYVIKNVLYNYGRKLEKQGLQNFSTDNMIIYFYIFPDTFPYT